MYVYSADKLKGNKEMRMIIENNEDLGVLEQLKKQLRNDILHLMELYNIDISGIPSEDHLEDLLIDLGRLCYEYRHIIFTIENYKRGFSNELDIDTNQFCCSEDIWNNEDIKF